MSVPAVQVPMVEIAEKHTRGLGSLKAVDPDKAPLPLASVSLKARVIDRVAEVHVEQKFHNPYTDALEAVYVLRRLVEPPRTRSLAFAGAAAYWAGDIFCLWAGLQCFGPRQR